MSAPAILQPRQIDLAKIESVIREQRFTAGRYLMPSPRSSYRDAVGELAVQASGPITNDVLARVDRYSRGERWAGYGQHAFDNDCHAIDRVLFAAYGLRPCDRAALCAANDAPSADGYRWVAVCAAVKARNLMLAHGLDPDEAGAPMYRSGR